MGKDPGESITKSIVVLMHGSATAGRESFDLQVKGKPSYSLMDYLASEGFDVFDPDIGGFGRSTRPQGTSPQLDMVTNLPMANPRLLQIAVAKKTRIR